MSASDLADECNAAWAAGDDFWSIWQLILRIHPLVDGRAVRLIDGGRPCMDVPLSEGWRLRCDLQAGFSLREAVPAL